MRRAVDVVVSAAALVFLAPFLAVVAAAIKLTSHGPVLFTQARAGRGGAEFTIYKFRTMRPQRHPDEADSARLTAVGRALRASSLDELPQLYNVLVGDMSLIGPRPTLPEQVVHYSAHQRRRLEVRPGLTGWAQVNGRNSISWPERIELDIHYVDNRSLRLDLEIVSRTLRLLARPDGITHASGENPGFPVPAADAPPERGDAAGS